jgi:hypothetical protein
MRSKTLASWLAERTPDVPAPLLPHLLPSGGQFVASSVELGRRGGEAVSRALKKLGRDREAAFDLLAGDALLTYACEALAERGDVGAGLEALIQNLEAHFL